MVPSSNSNTPGRCDHPRSAASAAGMYPTRTTRRPTSIATAASGLATEFWHLLVARTFVAVGEAVLFPGAVSLLADLFSPDKRGRAMGVFGAGAPVGAGVGLLAGGLLLGLFTATPAALPFLGTLLPWQATFIAVGLPGVFIALLTLFVRQASTPTAAPTLPEGAEVTVQGTTDTVIVAPTPPGPIGIEGDAP